jgi:uncharacterized protein
MADPAMICYRPTIKREESRGWGEMKRLAAVALAMALGAMSLGIGATAAAAQQFGSDGYNFLKAVEERDANKAIELVTAKGSTVINYRGDKGDAALHVVMRQREIPWANYLLQNGADPNIQASNGDTPLITAARIGFSEGALVLLGRGARVDAANRQGETALIVAVQQRHPALVKLLLEKGANPDKQDTAAGYSARDYAKRDIRSAAILKLIETSKGAKPVAGPVLR